MSSPASKTFSMPRRRNKHANAHTAQTLQAVPFASLLTLHRKTSLRIGCLRSLLLSFFSIQSPITQRPGICTLLEITSLTLSSNPAMLYVSLRSKSQRRVVVSVNFISIEGRSHHGMPLRLIARGHMILMFRRCAASPNHGVSRDLLYRDRRAHA